MAYGTLKADVIQSDTANVPPQFNDGNGAQIGTLCRAWVNFNGTGTVAIRGSFNVSSITDNGTGNYTINFTTALPDNNYSAVAATRRPGENNSNFGVNFLGLPAYSTAFTTTAVQVCTGITSSEVAQDADYVAVSIFR